MRTNAEVDRAVRLAVQQAMARGEGIISGGALGVDSIALDEALKLNPEADRIKVFLPTSLETYVAHYRRRAAEKAVTTEQAEKLIEQLIELKQLRPAALVENLGNRVVDRDTCYGRNTAIVEACDELVAFPVVTELSNSPGTRDTIAKAEAKGVPVKVLEFNLTAR